MLRPHLNVARHVYRYQCPAFQDSFLERRDSWVSVGRWWSIWCSICNMKAARCKQEAGYFNEQMDIHTESSEGEKAALRDVLVKSTCLQTTYIRFENQNFVLKASSLFV